jgi:hypothetical protein
MRAAQILRHLIGPLELIHEQAGPRLLRLTRAGIFGLWLLKLLLDPLWRLADFPRELFAPVGIIAACPAALLNGLLTTTGLTAFWIVTLLVLTGCLTNRAFPLTSTLAAILLTIYSSLIRGFGPAIHTDIVLLLAVYVLALFSWADVFAARSRPSETSRAWSSFPIITIVMLLCLSYCLVGLNRTLAGGVRVFTGDTMEVWAIDAGLRGYYFNTNIGWHVPEWPWVVLFLRMGLPVITLFEITAPLCLVSSHYRWIFIPTMLSFHLLSLVLMNIFFFDDILLYLLLVDWSRKYRILTRPWTEAAG